MVDTIISTSSTSARSGNHPIARQSLMEALRQRLCRLRRCAQTVRRMLRHRFRRDGWSVSTRRMVDTTTSIS